jgi:hypothetical protein
MLCRLGSAFFIFAAAPLRSQSLAVDALLDGVAARLKATAGYMNWTAISVQTITELDRKGNPEKVTVVTKALRVTDGRRSEDILRAVVTEDGETRDITAKYAAEAKKRREEEEQQRAKGNKSRQEGERGGRIDLEELLPFAENGRPGYVFEIRDAADGTGRRLVLLGVKAKTRDPQNWDGTYTIDPSTFDILRAEIQPSKLPKMVKELSVEADFEVLDGKYLVLRRTRFKVNGGFLFIKRVRMTIEEAYSGVRVLDGRE